MKDSVSIVYNANWEEYNRLIREHVLMCIMQIEIGCNVIEFKKQHLENKKTKAKQSNSGKTQKQMHNSPLSGVSMTAHLGEESQ